MQAYHSIREDLQQATLEALNIVPQIINRQRIKKLKDHLPILSVIEEQYNRLNFEKKRDIVIQTLDQISQTKKSNPDLRDDLQYLDDVIRQDVVQPLVGYRNKANLANYIPELTKKLRAEIRRIAESGP